MSRIASVVRYLILVAGFSWLICAPAHAQRPAQPPAAPTAEGQKISVGTRILPPFVILENGALSGFSIDLWKAIAAELRLTTEFTPYDKLPKLLDAVGSGRNAAGIAAISITSERGEKVEFSQPMFRSGLSIMVPSQSQGLDVLGMLFSANMFKALLVFALLLINSGASDLAAGARARRRPAHRATYYPGHHRCGVLVRGIHGGRGAEASDRVFARIAAIIWIYAGIIFIAYFTAFATTTMTMNSLRGEINGPGDLRGKKVAVVEGSTSAAYTKELGAILSSYNDFNSAAKAVVEGKAEATVYDTPVIMFYARNDARAQVVGGQFRPESYGIIFPLDSPLRRPVNKTLLKLMENGVYEALYKKWFGQAEGEGSTAGVVGGSPSAMRS